MRDVLSCAAARIELFRMPDQKARPPAQLGQVGKDVRLIKQNAERVRKAALLDEQSAVHVGLAQGKFGVLENPAFGVVSEKANGDGITRSITAYKGLAVCRGDCHCAAANEFFQREAQQAV